MPDPKHLMFLSCNDLTEDSRYCLANATGVRSLYYCCGTHPVLVEFDGTLEERAALELRVPELLVHKSLTVLERVVENWLPKNTQHGTALFDQVLQVVFLRQKERTFCLPDFIEAVNGRLGERGRVRAGYRVVGNDGHNFCIELVVRSVNSMNAFFELCQDSKVHTSTKCVLRAYKDWGVDLKEEWEKYENDNPLSLNEDYEIAAVQHRKADDFFWNPGMRLGEDRVDMRSTQRQIIKAATDGRYDAKEMDRHLLIPDIDQAPQKMSRNALYHGNKLIDRLSIKLERAGWIKVLLFLKAELQAKLHLEHLIQKTFLGVTERWFARKFYHITGLFDFAIPVDCRDLDVVEEIYRHLNVLNKKEGHPIKERHVVLCKGGKPVDGAAYVRTIQPAEFAPLEALLENSTDLYSFNESCRGLLQRLESQLNEGGQSTESILLAMGDLSPREEYICQQIVNKERRRSQGKFTDYVPANLELRPSVEFSDHRDLVKTLVRCQFADADSKRDFEGVLAVWVKENKVINNPYESTRDSLLWYYIWKLPSLRHLLERIEEVRPFCAQLEFGIIFSQRYYSRNSEKQILCRPCFYSEAEQDGRHSEPECRHCIRYISPRVRGQIMEIDLEATPQRERSFSIAAIGIDLTGKDYERIRQDCAYRDAYLDCVKEVLGERISAGNNVIVLPEYAIPDEHFRDLRSGVIDGSIGGGKFKDGVIVFGSHAFEGYNRSPVLIASGNGANDTWHVFKNSLTDEELAGMPVSKVGKGHLKFMNTTVGNFVPLICLDTHRRNLDLLYQNLELVLVPAWNSGIGHRRALREEVRKRHTLGVYANTQNESLALRTAILGPSSLIKGDGIMAECIGKSSKGHEFCFWIAKANITPTDLANAPMHYI